MTVPATSFPMRKRQALALSVLFVGLLWLPTMDLVFGIDRNPVRSREPMRFPTFDLALSSLKKYPGEVEWYLRNTMGFQGTLLRLNGLFKFHVLKTSANPQVVLGKQGWLYLEEDIKDYRHLNAFKPEELEKWLEVVGARKRFLDKRGIRYFIVACPDKELVYDEYLPQAFKRGQGPSRVEQFARAVRKRLGVEVLDLTETLRAAKGKDRLYHKTDTHWNDLGAYVGYDAIINHLAHHYPSLKPVERSAFKLEDRAEKGGDLARIIGLKLDIQERALLLHNPGAQARLRSGRPITYQTLDVGENPKVETVSPRAEIPSAVFVRDSFGEALMPMLSEHVGKAQWLWTDYKFPAREIDEMRPSLVVEQWVGRTLSNYKAENPPEVNQ